MTVTAHKRGYKLRFYPDQEQEQFFAQTFGCSRLVYNISLDYMNTRWEDENLSTNKTELSKALTEWKTKDELAFLNEVSSVALQQSQRHAHDAKEKAIKGKAGFPKFKSKHRSDKKFTLTRSAFTYDEHKRELTVAKMDNPLNIVWSYTLPKNAYISSITISQDKAGRWFVSLLIETDIPHLPELDEAEHSVGIDLGLTDFAVLSTGEKVKHHKHSKKQKRQRRRLARSLSKKQKGSANREKARKKLARFDARQADKRNNFLHHLTTRLVRENQTIVIEDLAVKNLSRKGGAYKKGLNRAIGEASWSEFKRMLKYKTKWYGRELIIIDRFFPSTRMCSACGHVGGKKPLDVRVWQCSSCGTVHDRDLNAAHNILAAGLAVKVCGDSRSLKT